MDSDPLYSIGELSHRTGLTVKTIRFYSDQGIVPPTDRTPAGYRLYGPDALARLNLARTLRDLGLGLATVRKVLDREASIPEVTEAHANALDVQIQTLRLRRAVLRAVARRGPTTLEMDLMHRLATLSQAERHRLVSGFIDDAFQGLRTNPEFVTLMRSVLPELPADPTPEQVEAWVELAGLCQDPDFRVAIRRTAEDQADESSQQDVGTLHDTLNQAMCERIAEAVSMRPPTGLGERRIPHRLAGRPLRRRIRARRRRRSAPLAPRPPAGSRRPTHRTLLAAPGNDQRMARITHARSRLLLVHRRRRQDR